MNAGWLMVLWVLMIGWLIRQGFKDKRAHYQKYCSHGKLRTQWCQDCQAEGTPGSID